MCGIGLLLVALFVALAAWMGRPGPISFSNGSRLSVREVTYSRNAVYYNEPLRRLISRNRQIEQGWRWMNRQFPRLPKLLRITGFNSKAQGRIPALVVFGDATIIPDRVGFWEFVGVDSDGRESEPLETHVLDRYESYAEGRPKVGPCILAMTQSLPGEPKFVRVYEIEKNSSRRLLATLAVEVAADAAGTIFPIAPEKDTAEAPPKPEPTDSKQARVLSIFPADGAREVAAVTKLRIRFDRPMNPQALSLAWRAGGFRRSQNPAYDAELHEFTIPVVLEAGVAHQIVINDSPFGGKPRMKEGFHDPEGWPAASYVWAFRTAQAGPAASSKEVKPVSVKPRSGSKVPLLTFVEVQFGEPMTGPEQALPFVEASDPAAQPVTGPALIPFVEVDEQKRTFRVPIAFRPGKKASFTLAGFKTASGASVDPMPLEYEGTGESFSPAFREEIEKAGRDPRLLDLLGGVAQKRKELSSIDETIQSITLGRSRGHLIYLQATGSRFMWEAPNRYFADVAETMRLAAFRLGSDGTNWWWHVQSEKKNRLVICPIAEMHQVNASFCDPFGAVSGAVQNGLRYEGIRDGLALVSKWSVERFDAFVNASRTEWLIDPQTHRPAEVIQYHEGFVFRQRFRHETVNSPLAIERFLPPSMPPEPLEPLDSGHTNRFVNIMDGSDGRMSVRWGKEGPAGASSSGLN